MTAKTRCAVLTPAGVAAVATIAVVGPDAWEAVRSAVRGSSDQPLPADPDPSRIWLGVIGETPGDSVVVTVRRIPPNAWVEIHCHGGPQVVRWIVAQLCARGIEQTSWQEMIRERARSPILAAAELSLAVAPTARAAAILLDQARGALDAAFAEIVGRMASGDRSGAQQRLDELLTWADLGLHLVKPWRVVIAGAPNVGKSSLVNRLAGYQRSVVNPAPGTTRDLVSTAIAVDGWPVEIVDTAGRRQAPDELEAAGVELANESERTADLVVWLIDPASSAHDLPALSEKTLLVCNKIDLAPGSTPQGGALPISAWSGAGLDKFLTELSRRLVPRAPPAGTPVPFTPELVADVNATVNQLASGRVLEAAATLRKWLDWPANAS